MHTKEQKSAEIDSLADKLGRAKAAFLVDFKGVNVEQVTRLRRSLAPFKAEMKVVKNTLARQALKKHSAMEKALSGTLKGTNAVVFAYEDVSGTAKTILGFSEEVEELIVKTAVMDGQSMDKAKIKYLATLPGKDVLRAQFLGVLQAPMAKFLGTLNAVPSGFVRVLSAHKEKQSAG